MFFKYFVRHMGEIVDAVLLGLNYLQPPQTLKAYLQLAQALKARASSDQQWAPEQARGGIRCSGGSQIWCMPMTCTGSCT